MTLNELITHIHKKLDLVLKQKQPDKINIEVNISQGGIRECYLQHKAKLVDKQIKL